MRKSRKQRDNDRRFEEITSQLSDLEDLDRGPRDYSLAEPDETFTPPTPRASFSLKPWIFTAIVTWLIIVIVPIILWAVDVYFTAVTGFVYALVVVLGVLALFMSLRTHNHHDDDGAIV